MEAIEFAKVLVQYTAEEIEGEYSLENLRYVFKQLTGFTMAMEAENKRMIALHILDIANHIIANVDKEITYIDLSLISLRRAKEILDTAIVVPEDQEALSLARVSIRGLMSLIENDLT